MLKKNEISPASLTLDEGVVHRVQRPLSILNLVEVDVTVPETLPRDCVTADTDGSDGTDSVENLKEKSLIDSRGQVTHVQRRRVERRSVASGGATGSSRGSRSGSDIATGVTGGSRGGGVSCGRHNMNWRCFFCVFFVFFRVLLNERISTCARRSETIEKSEQGRRGQFLGLVE